MPPDYALPPSPQGRALLAVLLPFRLVGAMLHALVTLLEAAFKVALLLLKIPFLAASTGTGAVSRGDNCKCSATAVLAAPSPCLRRSELNCRPPTAHPPACAVLHAMSMVAAGYGAYVVIYDVLVLSDLQRGAINAALWAASKTATEFYIYRPRNTDLWLPVIPGQYVSIGNLAVSAMFGYVHHGCLIWPQLQDSSIPPAKLPSTHLQFTLIAAYFVLRMLADFLRP